MAEAAGATRRRPQHNSCCASATPYKCPWQIRYDKIDAGLQNHVGAEQRGAIKNVCNILSLELLNGGGGERVHVKKFALKQAFKVAEKDLNFEPGVKPRH